MKVLAAAAVSGILLVILFQCCPCTSVAPPSTPTPTHDIRVPVATDTPISVPTFTPVTIASMDLGQYGTYEGLSISLLWREWTDSRGWQFGSIDAESGHHILWIHVQAGNRSASPVPKPLDLRFDLWYRGRQVDGIFQRAEQGDAHWPPLECGPYRVMNPGEFCEGWLYFFPDVPDDWSREDLLVSYGGMCEAESPLFLPCLYWRLQ